MKYTGINIGPIIPTISMGRKPREIWAASYMFSFLMECIVAEIPKEVKIISPAILTDKDKNLGFGLYPDRLFIQGKFGVESTINKAIKTFCNKIGIQKEYLNVMHVTIDGEEPDKDKEIIKRLNQLLDCTELYNRPVNSEVRDGVLNLIQKKDGSPLFIHGHGSLHFNIPYLAEIATKRLEGKNVDENNVDKWKELCGNYWGEKSKNDGNEDQFYQDLKDDFKKNYQEDFFSLNKYICIVQADGDNMGKIVSSITADKVKTVSQALLDYGKEACQKVKAYGGLPIYAGGDDLLFIAPVRGVEDKMIFDLIGEIDDLYEEIVDKSIDPFRPLDKENNSLHTYLSYGLSISYYKYPLYEAFKDARSLLFDRAKNVKGKNAVSWRLRKHSGSGFKGEISKSNPIYEDLKKIMGVSVEEKLISAIAHKLKNNENLLDLLLKKYRADKKKDELESRLENFYKKVMEETIEDTYKKQTRELLCKLMLASDKKDSIETILENMYGMLRTAKFIKGEGDSDE